MPIYSQSSFDLNKVYFSDDFVCGLYNNRTWAVTGTGSATVISDIDAYCRIRGNAANTYRFNHGNIGAYSVTNQASIIFRASLIPGTTVGISRLGFTGTTNPLTSGVEWLSEQGQTNFRYRSGNAGTYTTQDSGVARDTNIHEFKIQCVSGTISFWLDSAFIGNITANITAENLQPSAISTGSTNQSDTNIYYVEATGNRA